MAVLIDKSTRLLVQGLTGREGTFHAKQAAAYGTTVVGGVTPGKGGTTHEGWPIFDTVQQAAKETGANASVVFVPPFFVVVFADNLMRLNALAPNPAYPAYLQQYADRAWSTYLDPASGLFDFHDREATRLLQQAAMAQLYAYLSLDHTWYEPPPAPPAHSPKRRR